MRVLTTPSRGSPEQQTSTVQGDRQTVSQKYCFACPKESQPDLMSAQHQDVDVDKLELKPGTPDPGGGADLQPCTLCPPNAFA